MHLWPDAAPFQPEEGAASPPLESVVRGPAAALPAVLLVAAASDAWAARSAASVARAFVRTGRRIVLVDAGLQNPSLHELLGVDNDQGLIDHFLFGTSLPQLAQPVEDGSWSLVPVGPLGEAYGESILASPGWLPLLAAAAAEDATLLVYAPAETPGLGTLAEHIGAVIGLLPEGSSRTALEHVVRRPYSALMLLEPTVAAAEPEPHLPVEPEPHLLVEPEALPPVEPEALPPVEPEALPPVEPEALAPVQPEPLPSIEPEQLAALNSRARDVPRDHDARHALMADLRARQRAALQAPPEPPEPADVGGPALPAWESARPGELAGALSPEAAAVLAPAEPPGPAPAVGPRPEEPSFVTRPAPRRHSVSWTLLVVLLLSVLAGAWHLWSWWDDAREARAAAATAPVVSAPPPPPAVPDTLDALLPYVVAIEAHQDLPTAERRILALRSALPGTGFLIVPLVREGTLYYHVSAGPAADTASAGALMDTLIARRIKTGGTRADVRSAPLALLIGEYGARDSADARVAELRRLDIPAYVLPLGPEPARWRIYAGGYNGPAEADVMRQLLQSAGVTDSLVPRTGRITR